MTRRRLTPDEIALWQEVTGSVDRMHRRPTAPPRPLPKPTPVKPPPPRFDPFQVGQTARGAPPAHSLKLALPDRLAQAPLAMNPRIRTRMKRGKLPPEARIDLHGKRLESAKADLIRFILTSWSRGLRLVLVITGKGRSTPDDLGPIPRPRGLLRHQVPDWLRLPPLAQAVLQIETAHVSHGGEGAYYVYLRR